MKDLKSTSPNLYSTTFYCTQPDKPQTYKDFLTEEVPMALYLNHQPFVVFMRTPGDDLDLTTGFLWTEGIIEERDDLRALAPCVQDPLRYVYAHLADGIQVPQKERSGYLSSSCGLCSLENVEKIQTKKPLDLPQVRPRHLTDDEVNQHLLSFEERLPLFQKTGGCHGAILYQPNGSAVYMREDVGRHNAVDKVLGAALRADQTNLTGWVLVVSSRAGFEIIQKAAVVGVSAVITLGAASGLAHRFSVATSLPLFSFARLHRFHRHLPPDSKHSHSQ